jgi:hypothetical protein
METKRQEPGKVPSSNKSQSAKTKKGKKSEEAKQETTPPKRLKLVSPLREKANQVNVERLLRKNIEMMSQKLG